MAQAKACQTQLEDNIVFNGPRAAINFNDGFGGGTNVSGEGLGACSCYCCIVIVMVCGLV